MKKLKPVKAACEHIHSRVWSSVAEIEVSGAHAFRNKSWWSILTSLLIVAMRIDSEVNRR